MGHNSIFGNFRIAWENFRVHFNEWGNKRREQREANNKKAIASNYKKVAVAKKVSDNERLKKQDLEQRKKEFLSLIEKEELRVSNSVNLTDDTEKKTIAAIPVKKNN